MRTRWLLVAAFALPMVVGAGIPGAAQAAFPGANGKIAFWRTVDTPLETSCIYTANNNGTGEAPLIPCDGDAETNPRWSPDGLQVAYQGYAGQLDLVNADGSNLREFFFDPGGGIITGYSWSPDGTEIAVSWFDCDGGPCGSRIQKVNATTGSFSTILTTTDYVTGADWSADGKLIAFARQYQLWVVKPDGTGLAALAPGSPGDNHSPSWSPSADKIAFVSNRDGNEEIYVMNANGTGQTRLTDNVWFDGSPRWSPDGTKMLFQTDRDGDHEIYVMSANGTAQTRLTNNPGFDAAPDWRPILLNYVRPKAASSMRVSLVPAFTQCVTSNRLHGPPLGSASCNPPSQTSTQLTVGSPESNGKPTNSTAFVRYTSVPGNTATPAIDEADMGISIQVTDVIRRGSFVDYDGEVLAVVSIRRTDRVNAPYPGAGGSGPGTLVFHTMRATVPCTPTTDTTTGATCNQVTSSDALLPGTIKEGTRTVMELGAVQLDDGGPDNDADTQGDNTRFMTSGVFVP